jgi:ATP-dependent Clp protease ATP-binding subunit ClpC
MRSVILKFPVLVREIEGEGGHSFFTAHPLFFHQPYLSHSRLDQCLESLKKRVKQHFRAFETSRAQATQLLWFQFNPSLQYHQYSFETILGKKQYRGQLSLVHFELKGLHFGFLPSLRRHIFMLTPEEAKGEMLREKSLEVAESLLKDLQKAQGEFFDFQQFVIPKGEFITDISVEVNPGKAEFRFEKQPLPWFFSGGHGKNDFEGGYEIGRVARDLSEGFPHSLRRAHLRDEYVERIQSLVNSKKNPSFVLVGQPGVGRHTLLEEVLYRELQKVEGSVKVHEIRKIWHLDPNRVIAGMSVVGWWQKRIEAIIKFLMERPGKNGSDRVLVDNPLALLRVGKSSQNSLTLSDVFKSYVGKRKLQVILIASLEEWKLVQEQDRRFAELFQVIRLPQPNYTEAFQMAIAHRRWLEEQYECEVTIKALRQLFFFQRNYLGQHALPGGVINLLEQLASKYRGLTITDDEVVQEFESISGLQDTIFDTGLRLNKDQLKSILERQLIGQPDAVEALTDMIHIIKARLNEPGKPLGSFMFIGPTGVGKTQAAKVLCNYLLESEDQLLRFDMNEYIDPDAVSRLIGGGGLGEGQLTSKVRYRPFSIVLLDEIEKAYSSVHDLLLQVLDDGRLTDSNGRTTDFSNTIIIMTSNIGAEEVAAQVSFKASDENNRAIYQRAIERRFRPEFINRIDRIVAFRSLQLEHIHSIARLQIRELLQRDGFVRRTTVLNISEEALRWVAERGFNARMGGRALKRQIENDLTTLSADQLIRTDGQSPILMDVQYQAGRLFPHILELQYVSLLEGQWLPRLPEQNRGAAFYQRLINQLDVLEEQVKQHQDEVEVLDTGVLEFGDDSRPELNWDNFQLRDHIAEVRARLVQFKLGYRDRYFKENPVSPLRLKGVNTSSFISRNENADKGYRNIIKDRLFQEEAILELRENYHFANPEFDSLKSEFLGSFVLVAFLQLFANNLDDREAPVFYVHIQSCVTGAGEAQIKYLRRQYLRLFEHLKLDHQFLEEQQVIRIKGAYARRLLEGETGIHLFYTESGMTLPIRLFTHKSFDPDSIQINTILRLYDQSRTVSDLRTGYSNDYEMTASELQLLVYAGLPKKDRHIKGIA